MSNLEELGEEKFEDLAAILREALTLTKMLLGDLAQAELARAERHMFAKSKAAKIVAKTVHPYFLKEEEYVLAHYFGSSIGRNLAGYEMADLDHKLLEHKEIAKALKGFNRSSRNG